MTDEPKKFTTRHKLLLASLATVTLSLGIVGAVAAAQSPPATARNEAPAGDEADGVDCEDGVDAVTGADCDGGPAANATDESPEGPEAAKD